MGFREAVCTSASTHPLGIFVGIGAFSYESFGLAAPLLTISQAVWTESRTLAVAETEVVSKSVEGGGAVGGRVIYDSMTRWIIVW